MSKPPSKQGFLESDKAYSARLATESEAQKSSALKWIMNLSAKIISNAAAAKANDSMPEGVFRTTTLSKADLASISDEDITKGTFNGKAIDLNTYAALMKSACQENPGLLATKEDQQKLMATAGLDEGDRKAAIQDILSARTPENATRDLVVKSMLAIRSEDKQSGSKMDVTNLARMLAPNMLDKVPPAEYAKNLVLCNSIAENVLNGALEKQRAMKPVQQKGAEEENTYESPVPVPAAVLAAEAAAAEEDLYAVVIDRDPAHKPPSVAVKPGLPGDHDSGIASIASRASRASGEQSGRPPMPAPRGPTPGSASTAENVLNGALKKQRDMQPVQQKGAEEENTYESPVPVPAAVLAAEAAAAAEEDLYAVVIDRDPAHKPLPVAVKPELPGDKDSGIASIASGETAASARKPMPTPRRSQVLPKADSASTESGVVSNVSVTSGETAAPARRPMPTPRQPQVPPRAGSALDTDSAAVVSDASVASSASQPKERPTPRPRPSAETLVDFKAKLNGILAAGPKKPGAATTEVNQGRT